MLPTHRSQRFEGVRSVRVALVHDWLTGMRGGEKVLEVFAEIFPGADLFTLVHVPGSVSRVIEERPIHVSPLNGLPGIARHYRKFLPLFPSLIERMRVGAFDLVLSTSSCVAKGVRPAPGSRHVSYVHSPMRYVWDRYDDYFGPGRADPATRAAMRVLRDPLRRWDRDSSRRVDVFVANSRFVAGRIADYYRRDAEVIPPPVDVRRFTPTGAPPTGDWLVVSAFAPYKRIELAIEAARLAGVPLTIVGKGPEEERLRRRAGSDVRFLGWISDEELAHLYARSRGLLFPGVEDFGITPLEVMAAGRPVIAFGAGGALETVRSVAWSGRPGTPSPTGILVPEQTAESLAEAIRELERAPERIRSEDCVAWAQTFSREAFEGRIRAALPRWTGVRAEPRVGPPA
jgi:glycosyltransferase involved in cell wall biosynthesis